MTTTPHDRRDLKVDLAAGDIQCSARAKGTGKRCRRPSALGANVCRMHGGSAPQVKAKAARRLEQAADVLVQRLLQFALDGNVEDATALRAIRDALDRAGLGANKAVDLNVAAPAFEKLLGDITSGSRDDYRHSIGDSRAGESRAIEHTPALADDDAPRPIPLPVGFVVDGEVVSAEAVRDGDGSDDADHAATPDDRRNLGRQSLRNDVLALPASPAYLPAEDALEQAAAANRTYRHQLRRQ